MSNFISIPAPGDRDIDLISAHMHVLGEALSKDGVFLTRLVEG